jgi:hypothetical protein
VKIIFWKCKELNSEAKKSRYVSSMHKYSVLKIQWLFIFKIRSDRFTSIALLHVKGVGNHEVYDHGSLFSVTSLRRIRATQLIAEKR